MNSWTWLQFCKCISKVGGQDYQVVQVFYKNDAEEVQWMTIECYWLEMYLLFSCASSTFELVKDNQLWGCLFLQHRRLCSLIEITGNKAYPVVHIVLSLFEILSHAHVWFSRIRRGQPGERQKYRFQLSVENRLCRAFQYNIHPSVCKEGLKSLVMVKLALLCSCLGLPTSQLTCFRCVSVYCNEL